MSHYRRGRALEYEVRSLFENAGWWVIRGAGSKGEFAGMKADLVATKCGRSNEDTIYIAVLQCKRGSV